MPNHFTDLGFDVVEANDLTDLLLRVAGAADEFALDSGRSLLRWGAGAGIELWIQVNPFGELVGVHPFFLGPTRARFLIERIDSSSDHPHDAALMGWIRAEPAAERYPARLDLPAYPLGAEGLGGGDLCEVQVAAFAEEIVLYSDAAAFEAAQDTESGFDVRSFLPIGLLPPDSAEIELPDEGDSGIELLRPQTTYQPAAEAVFSGVVGRSELRANPFTQRPFWWLQVSTYGAEYDAVVDPDMLHREPRPGDIVQGQFWMAARIIDRAAA